MHAYLKLEAPCQRNFLPPQIAFKNMINLRLRFSIDTVYSHQKTLPVKGLRTKYLGKGTILIKSYLTCPALLEKGKGKCKFR